MIGYDWWKWRFGGDVGVVGRQIYVEGEAFTVAGVMPRGFEFPPMGSAAYRPVIWTSLNLPVEQERSAEILGHGPEAAPRVVEILRRVGAI